MALTGVQIFKLLPKTNCKKCGFPTCLAFAMSLAQNKVELSKCPDVSEDAKKTLGEASAPPIRTFNLGVGDKAVKMIADKAPDAAIILNCKDAAAAEAAVSTIAARKPLLYGATNETAEAMAHIARINGIPLCPS